MSSGTRTGTGTTAGTGPVTGERLLHEAAGAHREAHGARREVVRLAQLLQDGGRADEADPILALIEGQEEILERMSEMERCFDELLTALGSRH